jgi:hypothetical protein
VLFRSGFVYSASIAVGETESILSQGICYLDSTPSIYG